LILNGSIPTFVWEPQKAFSPTPQNFVTVVFHHKKVILKGSDASNKKGLKEVKKFLKILKSPIFCVDYF
jgi:hypothetical protein